MASQNKRGNPRDPNADARPELRVGDTCQVFADQLRLHLPPETFRFETTQDVSPLEGPLGQDRAVEALQFGLDIHSDGFNIFVTGEPGTGRTTSAQSCVVQAAAARPAPTDWCYTYNFDDPYRPKAIALPPGRGRQLVADVANLIATVRQRVHQAFASDAYRHERETIQRQHRKQHEDLMEGLAETARTMGFQILVSEAGIATVPLINGRPMSDDVFRALPEQSRQQLRDREDQLSERISQTLTQLRSLEQQLSEKMSDLDRTTATSVIEPLFAETERKHGDIEKVTAHLERMKSDIIEHLQEFRHSEASEASEGDRGIVERLEEIEREETVRRYAINLLVDNADASHAPVVVETNPTFYNLLGRIDYRARFGAMTTNLQLIKAGALHRANGGYLILHIREVLRNPLAWDTLKRALLTHQIQIENIAEQFSPVPSVTLRPEPIPLDVKVVLIGIPLLYDMVYVLDEDLRKLFKVKADFDTDMPRTPKHVDVYASFISRIARERALLPLDRSAVTRLVEHSAWLAGDQEKLSTRCVEISDLAAEASFWAAKEGSQVCRAAHVCQAIDKKIYRSNLVQEKVREIIAQGTIYIDTAGKQQAQINGLAVQSLGDYQFARPVRVTAQTSVGTGGVANIEREAHLSGPLHNKGFLILGSFLAGRYGQDKPLAVDAQITFEQCYDEVEGDSASSAELYALLSSLAGLPLRQDIAVTGSVDQQGRIQAVGAVTRKIEGFFDVCASKGLTGQQGVLIPSSNIRHLMVRDDVVDAVRQGRFHVWAVETIDQGIEILTGVSAGRCRTDGTWEPDTVNDRVNRRLREFADRLRAYGRGIERIETQAPPPLVATPRTPRVRHSNSQRRHGHRAS